MNVETSIKSVRNVISKIRKNGKSIALVPTMGSLHSGHIALIRKAQKECDFVVCSIFVNPTQFNNPDDFKKYPRDLDNDLNKLKSLNCDLVFIPDDIEMYPAGSDPITISMGKASEILEGAYRPGHFSGVAKVVSKLFNIIEPDKAVFGEKDLQQLFLIKKLVKDLNFRVEIISLPTIREETGLALSSRNKRLEPGELDVASNLYDILKEARTKLLEGVDIVSIKGDSIKRIKEFGLDVEYFECVDLNDFSIVESGSNGKLAFCLAVYSGEVRLIDNLII